jgi:hypothetical protein
MSTQVSDLYKKHHEVSEDIKSIQESIKDLAEELTKAKVENKGLQSEIILLVKQIASLEKIVNTLNLAQKLRDQKDDQDAKADVKSGPVVSIPPMPYATPKPVPAGSPPGTTYVTGTVAPGIAPRASTTVKGHGDANTPPSTPKTSGTVDSNNTSTGTPIDAKKDYIDNHSSDAKREPYWINDPAKGIMRNPKYVNPSDAKQKGKDVMTKPDDLKEDAGAGEQIPPF